jgi:hypothetical protein
MDLREASFRTGINERTLRQLIKEGKLAAEMVDTGPHHHWEISPEAIAELIRTDPGQADGIRAEDARTESGQDCSNCVWLKAQLAEKDQQIRELHVLLQRSQEQFQKMLPPPRDRRWWWPWG